MPSRSLQVLLALPSLALAVSLSDFTPRVSNLPTACNLIYQQSIAGCSASDFQGNFGCSQTCITALQNIVPFVQAACSNAGVTGNNPLNAFITGDGPHSLCANAPSATTSTSSTSTSTSTTDQPTTTQQQQTTTSTPDATTTSSSTTATTSTTAARTTTTSAPSSAGQSSSTSIIAKTSTAKTTSSATSSSPFTLGGSSTTTGTSTTSASGATQTGGNNSGGGSPFDTVNHGAATSVSLSIEHLLAGLAAGLVLLL